MLEAVSYTHLTLPTTSRRQRQMCIRDRRSGKSEDIFQGGSLCSSGKSADRGADCER